MSTPALTDYQQCLLDGHREMVAEFGASVIVSVAAVQTPLPVVMVFPEAGLDALAAAVQARADVNFQVERALAVAAGLQQETLLSVAGQEQPLHVTHIEDDPGCPLLYVSAEEVR